MNIVALVFPEAAYFVLRATGNQEFISQVTGLYHSDIRLEFHDDEIHVSIRDWISTWIRVSEEFLTKDESSVILTQKLSSLLASSEKKSANIALTDFFLFFFDMRNITIDAKKSAAYAEFILSELQNSLLAFLGKSDEDLKK